MRYHSWMMAGAVALAAMMASITQADVFNMPDEQTSLQFVPVGDPGNAADTAAHSGNSAGQGAVAYAYNIGKYEVTAGQYTAFLNAVGGVDTYALYNTNMWTPTSAAGSRRAGRDVGQPLRLLGGGRLRQPSGQLCELLGLLPVRQLAAQWPADRRGGCGHNGDGGVHPDE